MIQVCCCHLQSHHWGGRSRRIFMNQRPAWSTQLIPGQPRLYKETFSQITAAAVASQGWTDVFRSTGFLGAWNQIVTTHVLLVKLSLSVAVRLKEAQNQQTRTQVLIGLVGSPLCDLIPLIPDFCLSSQLLTLALSLTFCLVYLTCINSFHSYKIYRKKNKTVCSLCH